MPIEKAEPSYLSSEIKNSKIVIEEKAINNNRVKHVRNCKRQIRQAVNKKIMYFLKSVPNCQAIGQLLKIVVYLIVISSLIAMGLHICNCCTTLLCSTLPQGTYS